MVFSQHLQYCTLLTEITSQVHLTEIKNDHNISHRINSIIHTIHITLLQSTPLMATPHKFLYNRNQDTFTIRWYEEDNMSSKRKVGEKIVNSIQEGAELLEWISANNWSYTVQ